MQWDIFCEIIDNYGDAGVCWRLAQDLTQRGEAVRLWMNDVSILSWMVDSNDAESLQLGSWDDALECPMPLPDVLIEAFGCEIPQPYLHDLREQCTQSTIVQPVWLNLEYLSAEPYVERMHGLPSPVMSGVASGWCKHFFYPGFTSKTGGLLREQNLLARQKTWDVQKWRSELLGRAGLSQDLSHQAQWLSLFSYEAMALQQWLEHLVNGSQETVLLVAAGRSQRAFERVWQRLYGQAETLLPQADDAASVRTVRRGRCTALLLPFMPQVAFDAVLWSSDLNVVRGEDSFVRALWAGKPFVWHIYPQHDQAHHAKLDAFLDWMNAPSAIRRAFHAWNTEGGQQTFDGVWKDVWDVPAQRQAWQAVVHDCREWLEQQDDLVSQLQRHARQLACVSSGTD